MEAGWSQRQRQKGSNGPVSGQGRLLPPQPGPQPVLASEQLPEPHLALLAQRTERAGMQTHLRLRSPCRPTPVLCRLPNVPQPVPGIQDQTSP